MLKLSSGKLFFCVISLFLLAETSLAAEKMTDNWRITGYTKYRDAVFTDTSRLRTSAPEITEAWIKITPAQKSKYRQYIREYLAAVRKNDNEFHSIEFLSEINCSRHLIRFTKFVYFNRSGKIIHQASEADLKWYAVEQGSVWYSVAKEICP